MRIEVEFTDGFQLGVKKFEAQRLGRLPREEVDDAAAHGELAATGDTRLALIAMVCEGGGERARVKLGAGNEWRAAGTQRGG